MLNEALRTADRLGASPRERKALVLAGLVESNLQHDRYRQVGSGDRDSVGFLQQRPSMGWGAPGESVSRDTRQFLAAARRANRGGSAGQLAQSVQRSAFPERYDQRSSEAEALLRQYGGGGGAPRPVVPSRGSSPAPVQDQSGGQQLATLLLTQLDAQEDGPRPSMGLAAPQFAAQAVMPQGARSLPSQAPRQSPGEPLARALTAVQALGGAQVPPAPAEAERGVRTPVEGRPAPLRAGGGYRGTQGLARSLAGIGHELGLRTTSTKRQNTNPYSGKGSDHDYGNKDAYAYDISSGGAPNESMDRAAYRIMRQLGFRNYAMGQPIDTGRGVRTIRTKQGTFRVQVIYRGSGSAFGGNHLSHIHVGVKRVG